MADRAPALVRDVHNLPQIAGPPNLSSPENDAYEAMRRELQRVFDNTPQQEREGLVALGRQIDNRNHLEVHRVTIDDLLLRIREAVQQRAGWTMNQSGEVNEAVEKVHNAVWTDRGYLNVLTSLRDQVMSQELVAHLEDDLHAFQAGVLLQCLGKSLAANLKILRDLDERFQLTPEGQQRAAEAAAGKNTVRPRHDRHAA
jgi:hypothetical protein